MTTTATIRTTDSAHWYFPDSRPCHEVLKADGSGMRKTTLADARKLQLLPSVTTILRILDKPALNDWRVTQGVLAVETTPKLPEECHIPCSTCGQAKLKDLDAFLHRVLQIDRVQDQESHVARERGTEIHNALESYFLGQDISPEIRPWIEPAAKAISARGELVAAEKVLVGYGYAGKTDLIQGAPDYWLITDWKSSKTLPNPKKGAYFEHLLQASAYAAAFESKMPSPPIKTANVCVSTVEQGQFAICDHDPDWQRYYNEGFAPLVRVWQLMNSYKPQP